MKPLVNVCWCAKIQNPGGTALPYHGARCVTLPGTKLILPYCLIYLLLILCSLNSLNWFHLALLFWWICSHFLGVLGVGGQWRCHGHQPSLIPWRRRRVRLAVLQLRVSGLVERGKKLEAPQAVGWWSSRGERDSQTVDNNDTAWLFTIRWSRLSLQELQRLRFRGVSLLFGVMSLDFRKIWHVERFLRVRHIIIKGSCLTALERCTCCCLGCEAQSSGGMFFSLEGLLYNLHQGRFPKSQGIGGVGSWVVESLARSGIGGSGLQRFGVGWLVRRSSNWRNFTFLFSNKIPQRQVQDETSPATISVLLLAVFGGLP